MRTLLVLVSYHHQNTEQVAKVLASVLDAPIREPEQVSPAEVQEYDLVGFGSGIYDNKHDQAVLDLAARLPQVTSGRAFIFSTSGLAMKSAVAAMHSPLRRTLQAKGYTIVGEFNCAGHNTHGFLRWFGGMNRGRPNARDLKGAEGFAQGLKQNTRTETRDV